MAQKQHTNVERKVEVGEEVERSEEGFRKK